MLGGLHAKAPLGVLSCRQRGAARHRGAQAAARLLLAHGMGRTPQPQVRRGRCGTTMLSCSRKAGTDAHLVAESQLCRRATCRGCIVICAEEHRGTAVTGNIMALVRPTNQESHTCGADRKASPHQCGLLAATHWDQYVPILLQAVRAAHHRLAVVLELQQEHTRKRHGIANEQLRLLTASYARQ